MLGPILGALLSFASHNPVGELCLQDQLHHQRLLQLVGLFLLDLLLAPYTFTGYDDSGSIQDNRSLATTKQQGIRRESRHHVDAAGIPLERIRGSWAAARRNSTWSMASHRPCLCRSPLPQSFARACRQ